MKLSPMFVESLRSVFTNRSLLCLVLLLSLGTFAFAQEATVVGTVTDPTGAAIPNVSVTITNGDTGQVRRVTTNNEGQYVVPDLRIGNYTVRAEGSGFKIAERKDLKLQVGDRARVDFQMQMGTAQETVTVEAIPVAVQADTGEVSQIVTGTQVSQLASNGRSFYTFVNLTPGATSLQGNFAIPAPVNADANVSINGNRPSHNIYLLDGGEDLDRGGAGTFSVMPSTESIAEFRTLTSNYSAEYGLSSAGTMTTVLKSGTNAFHGSAWEVFRNDDLDANDYFRNRAGQERAELRLNLFGFNIGGPIWKDKTFFFYNMEWRRIVQGGGVNQKVPDSAWYPDADGNANFDSPIKVPDMPTEVLFRNCETTPAGVTPGSPFPNNQIPACMIEPNSLALLSAGIFPANNSRDTSGNPTFVGGNNVPSNIREEIVRIDHKFSDKFSIFGHFVDESILQTQGTTMWSGDNLPTVGNTFGNPSYSAVVHLLQTIRPNLLNEVAFNYNGNRINILPVGTPALTSPFELDKIFPRQDGKPNNIPTINLSSGTQAQYSSNWTPWVNVADSYQIRDDLSWAKGSHQLKFGFSWQLYKKKQDVFAGNYQGTFIFDGSFVDTRTPADKAAGVPIYVGASFADYLLGTAQQYNEDAIHDSGHWNAVSWAAYVQDNWRATRRLTLNLGLRWDGVPHTYEANHRTSNFYPNLYQADSNVFLPGTTQIDPANPHVLPSVIPGVSFYQNGIGLDGLNGTPKGLVDNHWAAFGPRIGFAYDLFGDGKTLLRGGFGMMYERIQGNDMYNMGTNIPFSASVTAHNVLLADPHDTTDGGTTPLGAIGVSDITGISKSMYKLPVTYQYSLGVQRQLGARSVFTLSYVGNQNRHQNYWTQVNLPDASLLPCLTDTTTGHPLCTGGVQPAYDTTVPFLGYHQIRLAENGANAKYDSLQTSLRGNVAKNLDLQFGYTWSKAIDPTTGNGGNGYDLNNVSNPYVGWKYDLGPSPFDRKHVAFVSFVYDVPFFRSSPNKFLKTAAGGWQVSGIVTMQSGAPIDITDGTHSVTSIIPNSRNRPDVVGPIRTPHTVAEWFDPSAFAAAPVGAWGDLGHDALRGPGRDNWNLSLFKNFNFTERIRLEFRADAFNVWNHTEFRGDVQGGGISTALGNGDFGQITSAYDPRQLQLGLKLSF